MQNNKQQDFIEIDRAMLQQIGFKNSWVTVNRKKGKAVLNDTRTDFSSAIRFLKKSSIFVQGQTFDDATADYIIKKNCGFK